jgi:quercetin dioxygenase-like cupin family protein
MKIGHYTDIPGEPQSNYGTTGTVLRTLIARDAGARIFSLRVITIEPRGQIGLHSHNWEHEIFVIRGKGRAFTKTESVDMNPDDFIWIPPDEEHGFENTGDVALEFVCCIPISRQR